LPPFDLTDGHALGEVGRVRASSAEGYGATVDASASVVLFPRPNLTTAAQITLATNNFGWEDYGSATVGVTMTYMMEVTGPGISVPVVVYANGSLRLTTATVCAGFNPGPSPGVGNAIPEPSTWAMLLCGLAGLGAAGAVASPKTATAAGYRPPQDCDERRGQALKAARGPAASARARS
jgi:hypothetical protein